MAFTSAVAAGKRAAGKGGAHPKIGKIDTHFHFAPDFWIKAVQDAGLFQPFDHWSIDSAYPYFEKYDVAAGVLSVSSPGINFMPPAQAVSFARRLNETAAEIVRDKPARFGSFATLPMVDVDATVREIAHGYEVLGIDGVGMLSNVNGVYPGDAHFDPVLQELNRHKAVVFIHPTSPVYGTAPKAPDIAEWPFDTARAAISLIYSGALRRYPDIRFILAHGGGGLAAAVAFRTALFAPRIKGMTPPFTEAEAYQEMASFYYDLALGARGNVLGALRGLCPIEHVLFGTDWTFAPDSVIRTEVDGFNALKMSPAERLAIGRGNALKLFPRLAKAQSTS